jgi:hypothetical protein
VELSVKYHLENIVLGMVEHPESKKTRILKT